MNNFIYARLIIGACCGLNCFASRNVIMIMFTCYFISSDSSRDVTPVPSNPVHAYKPPPRKRPPMIKPKVVDSDDDEPDNQATGMNFDKFILLLEIDGLVSHSVHSRFLL